MTVTATSLVLNDLMNHKIVSCPYSDCLALRCKASSLINVDTVRKERFCSTEDYEDCPVFLVRNMLGAV